MVNHPVDFMFKMIKPIGIDLPADIFEEYAIFNSIFLSVRDLEMEIYEHPNVAGWKAFYQAPQFYKLWINAVSLPIRMRYAEALIAGFNVSGNEVKLNVLNFAASLDNPSDVNDLINDIAKILFAQPISQPQIVALKEILIPGLPDFEWNVEYSDYASGNTSLEEAVENKLKALLVTMMKMPEFYLI